MTASLGDQPVTEPVVSAVVSPVVSPVVEDQQWAGLAEVLAALAPVEHRAVTSVYFEGRTFRETAALLAVDELAVSRAIAAVHRPVAAYVVAAHAVSTHVATAPARDGG